MTMMTMIIIIIKELGLGLSRLCSATFEQLWYQEELFAVLKTWCYFCLPEQFLSKIQQVKSKQEKKSTISQKTSSYANFLGFSINLNVSFKGKKKSTFRSIVEKKEKRALILSLGYPWLCPYFRTTLKGKFQDIFIDHC